MLVAGIGLVFMVFILQSIIDNADDEIFVILVGCFKIFEGIYLKIFFQEQVRFWNVRIFFVFSQVSLGWCFFFLIEILLFFVFVFVFVVVFLFQVLIIIFVIGGIVIVCLVRRAGIVTFIMQMRKLFFREVKVLVCVLLLDG